jgi:hypothetical protein
LEKLEQINSALNHRVIDWPSGKVNAR